MTESKSAVEVIAGVLRCAGIAFPNDLADYRTHDTKLRHLAAEVDEALGGLTRDHDYDVLVDGAGRAVRLDNVARWVGGWTSWDCPDV